MKRVRLYLTTAILALATVGCVYGAQLKADAEGIAIMVKEATERGAVKCAPEELALAETNLIFMRYELMEGDYTRASWHHRAAMDNAERALAITDPEKCAEKEVIIAAPQVVITSTDRDQDGILDDQDLCPDEPEDIDTFEDINGCPDPDNDGDTVLDIDDACPLEPGVVVNRGCPIPDRDKDGLADDVDACPDAPEDIDGNQDEDGCPEEDDRDGDGFIDQADKCPLEAEDFDLFEDEDGCPELDNDQDGLVDERDNCPLQPGDPINGGCPNEDRDQDGVMDSVDACPNVPGNPPSGCPKRVLVKVTATQIEIKEKINFETNGSAIKGSTSFEIIDQVASVLKSNPSLKVVVEGHTDDVGAADYNLRLSDDRANSVRDALIDRGVEKNRLDAVGFGEAKPIASNKSSKGRAENRRVEFKIVKK